MPLRIAWICFLVALGGAAGLPLDTVDFVCDTTAIVALAVPLGLLVTVRRALAQALLRSEMGLFC